MPGLPGIVFPNAPAPVLNPTPASTSAGAGVAPENDPRGALLASITNALAHPTPVAPPAPVLMSTTTDPLTQAINAKMAQHFQGAVTMANAVPVQPVYHAPVVAPVAPPAAPQTSDFTDLMAPLGGTFETMGHTAALAGAELFGSHQDVEAQKAALHQINQNQNTIAQGNARIGGLTGTAIRGGAALLQQVPALASMALAPEVAPEAEGSTFLTRALGATLRNGAAAAPASVLQGVGTSIGAGQGVGAGLAGGAANALALGATGGSLAPEVEAIKAGHIASAMGHNAVLGAGSGGAMQLGQNIETGAPITQGVGDAAGAGMVGGAVLGGAGAAVSKAGRSLLTRIGVLRKDIGAPPLEEATPEPIAPAPLMLTHDGAIKVPPTDASQTPLTAGEEQPGAGRAYAQNIQDGATQALARDAAVQDAAAKMGQQAKLLALPAPAPFEEAVKQYSEIGDILQNPKLDSPGVADAITQAGIKPTSLPAKVKNAGNIVEALQSHAETGSMAPDRAAKMDQAAANVRQHLSL
ncbi:MAG: hypothetical protein ACYC46_16495, partial [Acidobacteriaceae bacterium]